jgi:hypothetical protein
VIPALVTSARRFRRHYDRVRAATAAPPEWRPRRYTHTVVVLVGALHKGTLNGLHTPARSRPTA